MQSGVITIISEQDDIRQKMITTFIQHLKVMNDNRKDLPKIRDFLSDILLLRKVTPPIIEFTTILKHKMPTVYRALKESCIPGTAFHQLLMLEVPLDTALERLGLEEDFLTI
jgi:hypothetical protein